jgi:hypothetical protein
MPFLLESLLTFVIGAVVGAIVFYVTDLCVSIAQAKHRPS